MFQALCRPKHGPEVTWLYTVAQAAEALAGPLKTEESAFSSAPSCACVRMDSEAPGLFLEPGEPETFKASQPNPTYVP